MDAYIAGHKIATDAFPYFHGKSGEDLFALKSSQIREYDCGALNLVNSPEQSWQWLTILVSMQNDNGGFMIAITNMGNFYFSSLMNGKWQPWFNIFNSKKQ